MRKICAVTANRADFSRIETILRAVKGHPNLELQLVVMGSHLLEKMGNTIEEIRRKGFEPDRTLYMEVAGGNPVTMTKSVGLAIIELSTIFDQLRPDIVLVPVDRFESLAIGTTASLMNIYVAHTQGGEVTGTIDESIRHALTKLSHFHFVSTDESRKRVVKMGEPENLVFNIGCPGTDLILEVKKLSCRQTIERINNELIKQDKKLDPDKPFFFVLQHPVTTEYEGASHQIEETLEALKNFDEQIIVLWPNIDAGSDDITKTIRQHIEIKNKHQKIVALKHIPTELFVNTERHAACFIGNSSSGVRETCYFGTPTVNIGSRQNGRERGANVLDVGYDRHAIAAAIRKQRDHGMYPAEYLYGNGTAGKQFADICARAKLPSIQKRIAY